MLFAFTSAPPLSPIPPPTVFPHSPFLSYDLHLILSKERTTLLACTPLTTVHLHRTYHCVPFSPFILNPVATPHYPIPFQRDLLRTHSHHSVPVPHLLPHFRNFVMYVQVCGANYKTFQSSCHAACGFAAPSTAGPCDSCAQACTGRMGLMADKSSTFQATCNKDLSKQFCSFPSWPLSPEDYATAGNACAYMLGACTRGCTEARRAARNATFFGGCMTSCLCAPRTTCTGDLFPDYCPPTPSPPPPPADDGNSTTNGTAGNSTVV